MKNLFQKLKSNKKNNKGFTLVELIIVVAIIAVLAGVLAPQYLRYVERSRESNDLQVATSIMRAATVAIADPRNEIEAGATYIVKWTTHTSTAGTASLEVSGATAESSNESVENSIAEVMGWTDIDNVDDAQSGNGNDEDFEFKITVDTGAVELTDPDSEYWGPDGIGID